MFFFFFLANEKPPIKLCNCLSPLRTILYIQLRERERERDFINNCYTILTICHSF